MSEFDDLNQALTDLKTQLRQTTTAADAVNRLGAIADGMQKNVISVETRLKSCEKEVSVLQTVIQGFQNQIAETTARTVAQWQEATKDVVNRYGQTHVAAVSAGLDKAGAEFSCNVKAMQKEWLQRELSLKRAHTLNWVLAFVTLVLIAVLGFVTGALQKFASALAGT